LRGLPNIWVHSNEGKDVVGHLIFGERTD
jgi:hypothetical protein